MHHQLPQDCRKKMRKIPTPYKHGDSYQIRLMVGGKRLTATRDTAKECEQWAALKLLEEKAQVKNERAGIKLYYSFGQLLDTYYAESGRNKKSAQYIKEQLHTIKTRFPELVTTSIHDITPQILTKWRNERQKTIADATVLREMALFGSIFSYARKELFLLESNPFDLVAKPKQPKARSRRITDDEVETLIAAFEYKRGQVPTEPRHYVAWCFLFALETAMRQGEILAAERKNIFARHLHLPDTKNGHPRDVPLLQGAKDLIALIQHDKPKLFPNTLDSFKKSWQRGLKKSELADLHFHDTRHEAISRFVRSQKVPVEILMKITGHRTSTVLINTYYNPTVDEIADMLEGN
jgi:integrase